MYAVLSVSSLVQIGLLLSPTTAGYITLFVLGSGAVTHIIAKFNVDNTNFIRSVENTKLISQISLLESNKIGAVLSRSAFNVEGKAALEESRRYKIVFL